MNSNAETRTTRAEVSLERVNRAAERLGVEFHDPQLLRLALTHRSYLNEQPADEPEQKVPNERLEFLGDAILGMLTAEFLYKRFPEVPEGQLTAFRAALVRTETLASWTRRFGLDDLLYLGRGELTESAIRDRILAGAFEAVLAAIYLDRGLRYTRSFLWDLLASDAERIIRAGQETNYKGRLQEMTQDRHRVTPVYHTVAIDGPAHDRIFTVDVLVDGQVMGRGHGQSKRTAQQQAARQALIELGTLEHPPADNGDGDEEDQ
jgi:ribonuclease-3